MLSSALSSIQTLTLKKEFEARRDDSLHLSPLSTNKNPPVPATSFFLRQEAFVFKWEKKA